MLNSDILNTPPDFDNLLAQWIMDPCPLAPHSQLSEVPTEIDRIPRQEIPETPLHLRGKSLSCDQLVQPVPPLLLELTMEQAVSPLTVSPPPLAFEQLASPSTIPLKEMSPSSPLPSLDCVTGSSNLSELRHLELCTSKGISTPILPSPSVLGKRSLENELTLSQPEEAQNRTVPTAPKKKRAKKVPIQLSGENSQTKVIAGTTKVVSGIYTQNRLPVFRSLCPDENSVPPVIEFLGSMRGVMETYSVSKDGWFSIEKRFIPDVHGDVSIPLD